MRRWLLVLGLIGCGEPARDTSAATSPSPGTTITEPGVAKVTEAFRAQRWPVDILVVVEDAWFSTLRERYPDWMATLPRVLEDQELDFHVGLITMDPFALDAAGRLQPAGSSRWLNNGTADLEQALQRLGTVERLGTSAQSGQDSVQLALGLQSDPGGYNEGFLREEADLYLFFASDLPDSSSVGLASWAPTLKAAPYNVVATSITDGAHPEYPALAQALGGTQHSTSDMDWSASWEDLVTQDEVHLGMLRPSTPPKASTLTVWTVDPDGQLDELPLGAAWSWVADPGVVQVVESWRPAHPATYRIRYTPESP